MSQREGEGKLRSGSARRMVKTHGLESGRKQNIQILAALLTFHGSSEANSSIVLGTILLTTST